MRRLLRPAWYATTPDGLAHAYVRDAPRSLCLDHIRQSGLFDWPTRELCSLCQAALEQDRKEVRQASLHR